MTIVPTAIKDKREDQSRAPAMPVHICAENDGAERSHQIACAKRSQRHHQRRVGVAGGKNFARDVRCVVRVHHEVVHLQKVAAGDAYDIPDFRALLFVCS